MRAFAPALAVVVVAAASAASAAREHEAACPGDRSLGTVTFVRGGRGFSLGYYGHHDWPLSWSAGSR